MKKSVFVILCLVSALLLNGCAAKKKAAATAGQQTAPEKVHIVTIQEKTIAAQPHFVSLYAPKTRFTINYEQRQISANGSITLLKDSILIVSVQPLLGIELLRLEATKYDVTVVDKMNKRYVQMNYDEIRNETGLPVQFADVQALAMNRLFVIGKPQSYFLDKDIETVSQNGTSTLTLREDKLLYTFVIDETLLAPLSIAARTQDGNGQTKLDYKGHSPHNGILFPSALTVSHMSTGMSGDAEIVMPSLVFNDNVNASRIRLGSYKKTTLTNIFTGK